MLLSMTKACLTLSTQWHDRYELMLAGVMRSKKLKCQINQFE